MRGVYAALVLIWGITAHAEVVEVASNGFVSQHQLVLAAPPQQAFEALTRDIRRWWDGRHSFGGSAQGFSLEARAGGCLCEQLPNGGSVEHMSVVNAQPGALIVLRGGLGPLQGMGVAGSMRFAFEPHPDGSLLTYRYTVGGFHPGGLQALAEPVDRVQLGQLERLQQFIATGKALN